MAAFVCAVGCYSTRPNPLEGWKGLGSAYRISCPFGQTIIDDYQSYIRNLPNAEGARVNEFNIKFYEGTDNQRAVEIIIPINGIRWAHVLIYDQKNTRIKVSKVCEQSLCILKKHDIAS